MHRHHENEYEMYLRDCNWLCVFSTERERESKEGNGVCVQVCVRVCVTLKYSMSDREYLTAWSFFRWNILRYSRDRQRLLWKQKH